MTIVIFFMASAVIARRYLENKRIQSRRFYLTVMMNAITVVFVLITIEIAIRTTTHMHGFGETWAGTLLMPRDWDKVAQYHQKLLDQASNELSFQIYDDLIGWTNGPNRRSADGLYWSSSEGIRAPHAGVSFGDSGVKKRIALVGDSNTFGQEVPYEDTWGYFLQKTLGAEVQVLNFGVAGYGIDQAYLRYEKDVRPWKPRIVIFGFVSGDAIRSMVVYPFIKFPWDTPFSTPRLIESDGVLKRVNVPSLAPETIFSRKAISELPFLEYDIGYQGSDWEEGLIRHCYLARLFVSMFPRWSAEKPDVSEETVSVNASILKEFVRLSTQSGSIPIVVFFPQKAELTALDSKRPHTPLPIGKRVLQAADIAFTDITPCLLEMDPVDRFVPSGNHYSPQGNAKIANCLDEVVEKALALS